MTRAFEAALRDALTGFDIDLPHALREPIAWLQERVHRHTSPAGQPFLSVAAPDAQGALWSHEFFDLPPDLMRFRFGAVGMEKQVIPFMHCGGDDSHIALWRHGGAPDRYVFLGSEGEAFAVAERPDDLIAFLTLGFPAIERRDDLVARPEHVWEEMHDGAWPGVTGVKAWVKVHFWVQHPMTAEAILPYISGDDPFIAFVAQETGAAV